MSVEDRLRTATRERAALVRDIRPLELGAAKPLRRPRAPRARHLTTWLAPVAAAAVVVALAIALITVREIRNGPSVPPAPSTKSAGQADVPRYYVALGALVSQPNARGAPIVGDSHTGKVLASVKQPTGLTFEGVTGAADDRTFVLDAVPASDPATEGTSPGARTWYLLRIAPGAAHPTRLTRLPIAASSDAVEVQGLALSPDGSKLAVLYVPNVLGTGPAGLITLRIYSVSSGAALHSWTAPAPKSDVLITPADDNLAGLSWTAGGRRLDFRYPVSGWPDYERTLDVTSKGTGLIADSRSVFAIPGDRHGCASLLAAADGRTLVCGTVGNAIGGCVKEEPEFDLYSTATGKLTRVLYRYHGTCEGATSYVLWAGSGGTAIGLVQSYHVGKNGKTAITSTAGLLAHGTFVPLHITLPSGYPVGTAF
jgi:hypothetical protein